MSEEQNNEPDPSRNNSESDDSSEDFDRKNENLPSDPDENEETTTFVEIPLDKYQSLQEKAQERDDYLEQLRKVTADYDNYQKRMRRKRSEEKKYAARDIVKSLLPVLDDFDHALPSKSEEQENELVQGMRMIYKKLVEVLNEQNVEQIDEEQVPFDPSRHEATTYVEDEEVDREEVAEVLRKGYQMHDQVLRPARVVIARPPQEED